MKPSFGNLLLKTGIHIAGICKIEIAPKEWISTAFEPDFLTGAINTPISLVFGRSWLKLELTPDSVEFSEKPKQAKGGEYFETTLSGSFNDLSIANLAKLITIKDHELVVKISDAEKTTRVLGTIDKGCNISIAQRNRNSSGGTKETTFLLSINTVTPAPYYTA
jgi:hypothetical protein